MSEETEQRELVQQLSTLHVSLLISCAVLFAASLLRDPIYENASADAEALAELEQTMSHHETWLYDHAAKRVLAWKAAHPQTPPNQGPARFALRLDFEKQTLQSFPLLSRAPEWTLAPAPAYSPERAGWRHTSYNAFKTRRV